MTTPPEPTGPPQPAPPADPPRTFTQADLDRLLAREKGEIRRTAETALAEQLGMPVADAKKLIDDARARADAEKTELEKARELAQAAQADAEKARTDAARERHAITVERALRAAEANGDPELLARMVDVPVGADQTAITAAVEVLKAKMPALFGQTAPAGGAPSDPGRAPARPGQAGDSRSRLQRGAELARERGRGPSWSIEGGKIRSG